MISMSKAYSIRQPRMEGDSIAEISRKLEVFRDTVRLQVLRDGGSLAEAARAVRQGQRARPIPAAVFDTVFIARMSETIFHQ